MCLLRLLGFSVWLVILVDCPRSEAAALEPGLKRALLAGEWQAVSAMLERDDRRASDPTGRLLMAHARLATNRNNDAALLFRSVIAPEELVPWQTWADAFLAANPLNPIALYLNADALARSGNLVAAIAGFGRSLAVDPGFALALNARGVAQAVHGDSDAALATLYEAMSRAPELADAHASFGALAVFQGWAPSQGDQGLRAFDQAIRLDPGFGLAWNGRGCLRFGDGEFEGAAADFRKAAELMPSLTLAQVNEGLAFAYASQLATVASLDGSPAMALESRFVRADALVGSRASANPGPVFRSHFPIR